MMTKATTTALRTVWILVVVDGRQPTHSVGMTLPGFADLLIEFGADDAVNLGGGGSSSFYSQKGNGTVLTNRPSDGRWRPVGNHLGFMRALRPTNK